MTIFIRRQMVQK